MATLRLLNADRGGQGHGGEIYSCAFAPDGPMLLTAGWDGHLRLWDGLGTPLADVPAAKKPLSCCAWTPDGSQWLSGSMEGLLGFWDAQTLQSLGEFMAHTRPISGLCYSPDRQQLATASWDRQVLLRKVGKEREGRALPGHKDMVAGCRYSADGLRLLTWCHDGVVRVFESASGRELGSLVGHADRVTAADLSPEGRWAASGGRDGVLKLWELATGAELDSLALGAEVRSCRFLLDGATLAVVNALGEVLLLSLPELATVSTVEVGRKVLSCDLASTGLMLGLGCEDGRPAFVTVEGLEEATLVVSLTPVLKETKGVLGRFLGTRRTAQVLGYTCPSCRRAGDLPAPPSRPFPCAACGRSLRAAAEPVTAGR